MTDINFQEEYDILNVKSAYCRGVLDRQSYHHKDGPLYNLTSMHSPWRHYKTITPTCKIKVLWQHLFSLLISVKSLQDENKSPHAERSSVI